MRQDSYLCLLFLENDLMAGVGGARREAGRDGEKGRQAQREEGEGKEREENKYR